MILSFLSPFFFQFFVSFFTLFGLFLRILLFFIHFIQCMLDLQNFEGIAPIFFGLSSPNCISAVGEKLSKELIAVKQKVTSTNIQKRKNYLIFSIIIWSYRRENNIRYRGPSILPLFCIIFLFMIRWNLLLVQRETTKCTVPHFWKRLTNYRLMYPNNVSY